MAKTTEQGYYVVTSPFVDKETNNVILPGAIFAADKARVIRLRAADVIGEEATAEQVEALTGKVGDKKEDPIVTPEPVTPEPPKGGAKNAGDVTKG